MANNNDHLIKQTNLINFNQNFLSDTYDEPTYLAFRVNFFPMNSNVINSIEEIISLPNNDTKLMSYNDLPEPLLQLSDDYCEEEEDACYEDDCYEDECYGDCETDSDEDCSDDYDDGCYDDQDFDNIEANVVNKPKDEKKSRIYSTYDYLKNSLGEIERAKMLKIFMKQLIDLTYKFPFYIKSIDGINDLLTVDAKRGYRVKKDATITLKCYESLDQRITTLKNLYKKIAWDDTFQRWILPDMMRYFRMDIYISEFRIFHEYIGKKTTIKIKNGGYNQKKGSNLDIIKTIKNTLSKVGNILSGEKTLAHNPWILANHTINNVIPTLKLECKMCEFDIGNMFSHLSSINVNDPKSKRTDDIEIKIKVGNINEVFYNGLKNNLYINDNFINIGKLYKLNDKTQKAFLSSLFIDRTGISFPNSNTKQKTAMFDDKTPSRTMSYLGKVIKNTLTTAVQYADNLAERELNKLMSTSMGNSGISFNDALGAISSASISTMYNTFKRKAQAVKDLFPEISKATRQDIELNAFESFIQELTNTNDTIQKEIAKNLLEWGKKNANSIDDYMNVINEATTLTNEEEQLVKEFYKKFKENSKTDVNEIIIDVISEANITKEDEIQPFNIDNEKEFSSATSDNNTIDAKIIL